MNYTYISCSRLEPKYVEQLDAFTKTDSYYPFYEADFDSSLASNIDTYHFLTEDDTIICFISLMPLNEKAAAELTGFTLPAYRHRGLFTMLLDTVMGKLSKSGIRLYTSGRLNYPFIHNEYFCTDYIMEMDSSKDVTREHIKKISQAAVNAQANAQSPSITEFEYELENAKEYIYLLSIGDVNYGLIKFTLFRDTAWLSHVKIRKKFRGLGYGKSLLMGGLGMFIDNFYGRIRLHVSGENAPALHIYEAAGFKIIQKSDTYAACYRFS